MGTYKRGTSLYAYCLSENQLWILEQFDTERNAPFTPEDLPRSSNRKAWFSFQPCGHSCLQRISDKTGKNSRSCPACLNRRTIGKSLLSEYPDYAAMFHVPKNGITPDQVPKSNNKNYWWKCPRCGSVFQGRVSDVVRGKRVCGECTNKKRSFPEYCLGYYFLKADKDRQINRRIDGYQFDFYLPKYNLLVEYDGYPWHNRAAARANDEKKDQIARSHNIPLLRLRDSRLEENPSLQASVWKFSYDEQLQFLSQLDTKLQELAKLPPLDIQVKRDFPEIRRFQFQLDREESLLAHMSELPAYLDPENDKNGKPDYVCNTSHKIRFWLRHPVYRDLKWTMSAHDLFRRKDPFNQWIKMCIKVIEKYPDLESQVCVYGSGIREQSVFRLKCPCGREFPKTYAALMGKGSTLLCGSCLTQVRLRNLGQGGERNAP